MAKSIFSDLEVRMIGESRWSEKNRSRTFIVFVSSAFPALVSTRLSHVALIAGIIVTVLWFSGSWVFLVSMPRTKAGKEFLKEYRS